MTGNDRDYYTENPDKAPPYLIGEWDQEVEQDIEFGWSDYHIKTAIPKKGSTRDFATHYYSKPPPSEQWNLTRVAQKGRAFLIGSVEVGQLDAFCSVPQLPKEMDSTESAKRVLNKKKGEKEWQRRVDRDRVGGIKRFIRGSEDNLIANSVILYVLGENDLVTGAKVKNNVTGEESTIPCTGFFVAIGHDPNTKIFKDYLNLDEAGYIEYEQPGTAKTNVAGVFVSGDAADKTYRQAVTAAGTGCMAALEAERYLAAKHG